MRPIVRASNGEIMVPVGLHPWDEEKQKIYLPVPNAYLFQDAGVMIAKWLPNGSDVEWKFGEWLRIDYLPEGFLNPQSLKPRNLKGLQWYIVVSFAGSFFVWINESAIDKGIQKNPDVARLLLLFRKIKDFFLQ